MYEYVYMYMCVCLCIRMYIIVAFIWFTVHGIAKRDNEWKRKSHYGNTFNSDKKIAIMFLMDLGEPYNSTSINALR